MHRGYFKFWRCFQDNPRSDDADYVLLWVWFLMLATHKPIDKVFKGKKITLKAGQFITGRKFLAEKTKISESKIERLIKVLKTEQQIEQQTSNVSRLITIVNWNKYQANEQQTEQPVNNERTTSEQPVDTNKNNRTIEQNNKRIKEDKISEILNYFIETTGKKISPKAESNRKFIRARLNEDYSVSECKKVIDVKTEEWKGTESDKYIRIETLFNATKFQGYVTQNRFIHKEEKKEQSVWDKNKEMVMKGEY